MSHPLQTSSIDKWIDAPTRRVDAAGATFVYRRAFFRSREPIRNRAATVPPNAVVAEKETACNPQESQAV